MVAKLFVGNLSFEITDLDLKDLFSEQGEVLSAKVVSDRRSGRSRGFGFVEMNSEQEAEQAIETLNKKEVHGRQINVSFAKNRENNNQREFNNRTEESGFFGSSNY